MNYEAVYRTAPATPGLLIKYKFTMMCKQEQTWKYTEIQRIGNIQKNPEMAVYRNTSIFCYKNKYKITTL